MEYQFDMINNQSEVFPIIQNVVSTADLGCKLTLSSIALKAKNAEYNPKRLTAVVMRIREPKTTALIFSSGKIVCTGAKTVEDSKLAARKYARIVQKLGFRVKFLDFKIRNIVGSCDVKCLLNLEMLMFKNAKYAVYEPELFPGLIYKMISPCVTVLVFTSGKIVIAGAKKTEDVFQAFQNIYPVLQQVKKTVPN